MRSQDYEEDREKNYNLYYAVLNNEIFEVKSLLEMGANVNYINPGIGESTLTLSKRLDEQGKLRKEIKKLISLSKFSK